MPFVIIPVKGPGRAMSQNVTSYFGCCNEGAEVAPSTDQEGPSVWLHRRTRHSGSEQRRRGQDGSSLHRAQSWMSWGEEG